MNNDTLNNSTDVEYAFGDLECSSEEEHWFSHQDDSIDMLYSMTLSTLKLYDDAGNLVATGSSGVPVNSPNYITSVEIGSITLADVNYDGIVDITDVVMLREFVVNS